MKRFFVAIPKEDGGVELHPMKEWLRQHPIEVPPGFDATASTSHQLRGALRSLGWSVQETEHDVRMIRPSDSEAVSNIARVLGDADSDDTDGSEEHFAEQSFGLEHQLRDFLAQNLHSVRVEGRAVRLYVDPAGRDGVEYPTDVGFIDILAVDDDGAFVVFELKRANIADRAVGQLARYMGWVKHTIGRGRPVHGVIVAKSIDPRLKYAATVVPNVSLFEYEVKFELRDAGGLPMHSGRSANPGNT